MPAVYSAPATTAGLCFQPAPHDDSSTKLRVRAHCCVAYAARLSRPGTRRSTKSLSPQTITGSPAWPHRWRRLTACSTCFRMWTICQSGGGDATPFLTPNQNELGKSMFSCPHAQTGVRPTPGIRDAVGVRRWRCADAAWLL